jgi:SAM-dependent methyltransferase
MWEYGSALTAYHDTFGDKLTKAIEIGSGNSPFGAALAISSKACVKEVDCDTAPWGVKFVHDNENTTKKVQYRIDKAENSLARQLYIPLERLSFEAGDLRTIDTATKYDAVFCLSVIEHVLQEGQQEAWEHLADLVSPGGLLVVTTDFGPEEERPWAHDTERNVKFTPSKITCIADTLKERGFTLDLDLTYHGDQVYDYSFFRIIAQKSSGL